MISALKLEDIWREAAADLSVAIAVPYEVALPSGSKVMARVLVIGFGAKRGMLLVQTYSDVSSVMSELIRDGYGFSVMEDPLPGNEYDRQAMIDVLRDWGWSGPENETPHWLLGPP